MKKTDGYTCKLICLYASLLNATIVLLFQLKHRAIMVVVREVRRLPELWNNYIDIRVSSESESSLIVVKWSLYSILKRPESKQKQSCSHLRCADVHNSGVNGEACTKEILHGIRNLHQRMKFAPLYIFLLGIALVIAWPLVKCTTTRTAGNVCLLLHTHAHTPSCTPASVHWLD